MKRLRSTLRHRPHVPALVQAGFSLVEVTVAIGIFAFVVVAILGLFPTALNQRRDAAIETRSVLVAQQMFNSILGSTDADEIFLPPLVQQSADSDGVRACESRSLGDFPILLRFGERGTAPLGTGDPDEWTGGSSEAGVDGLALVRIEAVAASSGLYRATVDYGWPATQPEARRKNVSFSKFVFLP